MNKIVFIFLFVGNIGFSQIVDPKKDGVVIEKIGSSSHEVSLAQGKGHITGIQMIQDVRREFSESLVNDQTLDFFLKNGITKVFEEDRGKVYHFLGTV